MSESQIAIGRIEHLTEGWAVLTIKDSDKAHYWREIEMTFNDDNEPVRLYESACGVRGMTHPAFPALDPGTFSKCKRCQKVKK